MVYFGINVEKEVQNSVVLKFSEYLTQNKLMATKCKSCGIEYLPPRSECRCLATDMEWVEQPLEGTLTAWTIIHFAPAGMEDKAPYVVGIVKLSNGNTITVHLAGLTKPPEVGMKVKLKPGTFDEERSIIKAVPTS